MQKLDKDIGFLHLAKWEAKSLSCQLIITAGMICVSLSLKSYRATWVAWRSPVKEKTCFEANQSCCMNGLNLKINWQCSGWAMRASRGCDAWAWRGQYWEKMTCKLGWHLTACHFAWQCPEKTHTKKGFCTSVTMKHVCQHLTVTTTRSNGSQIVWKLSSQAGLCDNSPQPF